MKVFCTHCSWRGIRSRTYAGGCPLCFCDVRPFPIITCDVKLSVMSRTEQIRENIRRVMKEVL